MKFKTQGFDKDRVHGESEIYFSLKAENWSGSSGRRLILHASNQVGEVGCAILVIREDGKVYRSKEVSVNGLATTNGKILFGDD